MHCSNSVSWWTETEVLSLFKMKISIQLLAFAFLFIKSWCFPLPFFNMLDGNLDNVADRIFQDFSTIFPRMPIFPKQRSFHVKFIPNRVFIGRLPKIQDNEPSHSKQSGCTRRAMNERQNLPIPILPKFSLVAVQHALQSMYPLGFLPANEPPSDSWLWVDDIRVGRKVKKLAIAGLFGHPLPADFEVLCLVRKEKSLQVGDQLVPFSFPPVMSKEGFLNEHNSNLVATRSPTKEFDYRRCLAFANDDTFLPYPQLPTANPVPLVSYENVHNVAYYSNSNDKLNSSYVNQPAWPNQETYNNNPTQQTASSLEEQPSYAIGFPSPPGYQLSLVNPSVYKSYGSSSNVQLIGLLPRYELPYLSGFLELPSTNFMPNQEHDDLEAANFFGKLWSDYSLALRVDTAKPNPPSFKFIILFRADNGAKLKGLNATVWPLHVRLDGQRNEYQLAHIPTLTYGSQEMLDSHYLLLAAAPSAVTQPAGSESKQSSSPLDYEMPAYPSIQASLTQNDGNSSTTTDALDNAQQSPAASDSPNEVDSQQTAMPKPLPSKKSWKNRSPFGRQVDEEINRVARQILAFFGTDLQ